MYINVPCRYFYILVLNISVNDAPSWSFQHSFTYPSGAQYLSSPRSKPSNNQGNNPWFFLNIGAQDVTTKGPVYVPNFMDNFMNNFMSNFTSNFGSNSNVLQRTTTETTPPIRRPSQPNPPIRRPTLPNPPVNTGPAAEPDDGSWLSSYKYNNICGLPGMQQVTHTIIGGKDTVDGEFPWIVAIFHYKERNRLEYQCGGSLISDRHVLTGEFL